MEFSGSLPVTSRRAVMALAVAAVLWAASGVKAQQAQGQTPPAQNPPAQQTPAQPPADQLKFTIDNPILVVYSIKPERAADFEAAWTMIRAAFAKVPADKADVKAFGDTLTKIYKVDFTLVGVPLPPGAPAVYVLQIDTPSKTVSYNPGKIVYETLHNNGVNGVITRPEADEIYKKLDGCFTGINPWPLVKIGG